MSHTWWDTDNGNDHFLQVVAETFDLTTAEWVFGDATTTVEVTVTDTDAVEVAGETWPVSGTYVVDSQGLFLVPLTRAIVPPASGIMLAKVVIDFGDGQRETVWGELYVQRRGF